MNQILVQKQKMKILKINQLNIIRKKENIVDIKKINHIIKNNKIIKNNQKKYLYKQKLNQILYKHNINLVKIILKKQKFRSRKCEFHS